MGRLSYAWIPHTTLGVGSTTPPHHLGRVEHWRAQPKVWSFRSPLFRLWSGCLVRPSPTFPAAPPQIPYGGFSPVRLQAQAPRSSVWSLPPHHSALTSDP